MVNKDEIGNDSGLVIGGGQEVPVTSISYSEEADISEVQFNDGLNPSLVPTSVSYSGSFEHSGGNESLRSTLYGTSDLDSLNTAVPVKVDLLRIEDDTHVYKFRGVIAEARDKEFPADDRTSVTYDFIAEELQVDPL